MKLHAPAAVSCAFLLALPLHAADDWIEQSDAITRQIMSAQAQFTPEAFSGIGVEDVDNEITDLNPRIFERAQRSLKDQLKELKDIRREVENPRVLQDIDILSKSVRDTIETAELNLKHLLPYYNLSSDIFLGFRSLLDPRNDPKRYPAALERLKKYTGSAKDYKPVTELAIARTWERFDASGLIGPYRGQLETDLENVERFHQGMTATFKASGLTGWEQDLELLHRQLNDYADWLRKELLPRAREDHRLPDALYADNLRNFGVDVDPHELIRAAQLGFTGIQMQMSAIARQIAEARGFESTDYRDVIRALNREQVPEAEVIDFYRGRLAELEAIIRDRDLVSLPERPAVIRLATEAEAAASPASFMNPPQLIGNTGQPGEFVLVTTNPTSDSGEPMDDFSSQASTWALTAHEARPGHEMQFAAMLESGVSLARAIYAFNSANVEGWGLYAESLVYPYLPLDAQLFALRSLQMRAARAFLDPMLNLGLIELAEALDFLVDEVVLSRPMAEQEVDRYSFRAPGQATAYYFGYMNLMSLRTEVALQMRDRFVERAFHDFVLAQGLLPPEILRNAVMAEFVAAEAEAASP